MAAGREFVRSIQSPPLNAVPVRQTQLLNTGDVPPVEPFVHGVGGFNDNNLLRALRTSFDGALRIGFADASADSFGRGRAGAALSLFDNKQINGKDSLFYNEQVDGGAASAFVPNQAAVAMTVNGTAGDRVIRQTRTYFNYHPGQGDLQLLTGTLGAPTAGVRQRVGRFDASNGMFFEQTETGLRVVVRTSTSGAPQDNAVEQAAWNLDKLDGRGRSGFKLDPTRGNIFVIDYAWLGVGSVRFGVVEGGRILYCHEQAHENTLPTVYASSPNLPLRYEIENIADGGVATMQHICSAVFSEGASDPLGLIRSDNSGLAAVSATSPVPQAVISIRPLAARPRVQIDLLEYTVFPTTGVDFLVEVYVGGAAPTGPWVAASENVEINRAPVGSIPANDADGRAPVRVASTYTAQGLGNRSVAASGSLRNALRPGSNIAGTVVDPITVVVVPLAGSADFLAALTWKELF